MPQSNQPVISLEILTATNTLLHLERVRLCDGELESPFPYGVYFYPEVRFKLAEYESTYQGLQIYEDVDNNQYFRVSIQHEPKITKLYVHWI